MSCRTMAFLVLNLSVLNLSVKTDATQFVPFRRRSAYWQHLRLPAGRMGPTHNNIDLLNHVRPAKQCV
jgi:hypothetical protein